MVVPENIICYDTVNAERVCELILREPGELRHEPDDMNQKSAARSSGLTWSRSRALCVHGPDRVQRKEANQKRQAVHS